MHGYDRVRNVQENVVMRTLKLVHCISLCKNNLNLPMFFFSALCLVASSSRSLCCHARSLAALR